MMTYSLTCDQGHDPEMLTVEAMNDDEAMMKMLPKSKAHLDAMHSNQPPMTEEQAKEFILGHWAKA